MLVSQFPVCESTPTKSRQNISQIFLFPPNSSCDEHGQSRGWEKNHIEYENGTEQRYLWSHLTPSCIGLWTMPESNTRQDLLAVRSGRGVPKGHLLRCWVPCQPYVTLTR